MFVETKQNRYPLALEGSVPAGVAMGCPRGGLFAAMPLTQLILFGPRQNGTDSETRNFRGTIRTGESDCYHRGYLPIGYQVATPQVSISLSESVMMHDFVVHEYIMLFAGHPNLFQCLDHLSTRVSPS